MPKEKAVSFTQVELEALSFHVDVDLLKLKEKMENPMLSDSVRRASRELHGYLKSAFDKIEEVRRNE